MADKKTGPHPESWWDRAEALFDQEVMDLERIEPVECDDPWCPGWSVFNMDADPSIQRCDICKQFEDDDAALAHVKDKIGNPT